MTEELSNRVEILAEYADENGITWKDEAKLLPKGDNVAILGLLADRLGIPFSAALDEKVSKEIISKLNRKEEI